MKRKKKQRDLAIQSATQYAIEIPFKVMEISLESMELIHQMATSGNPNSVTDAGVGALCARSAVLGAFMNVKINAASFQDKNFVSDIISKGEEIERIAIEKEKEIITIVNSKIKL